MKRFREAGVRLGCALGRFLKGQGCVPVISRRKRFVDARAAPDRACWKDRGETRLVGIREAKAA